MYINEDWELEQVLKLSLLESQAMTNIVLNTSSQNKNKNHEQ